MRRGPRHSRTVVVRTGHAAVVVPRDVLPWSRPAGSGPVVALGKLVADQLLELSAPLVVGGQQRVVRTTTAGGAPANVTAGVVRLGVPARLAEIGRAHV